MQGSLRTGGVSHVEDQEFNEIPNLATGSFAKNKVEARSRGIVCEQELVKSRLRVNAANVSVRKFLVTVCVWLSSS